MDVITSLKKNSAENFLEELEELDPDEFDIPEVEEPSLDSILNEENDEGEDPILLDAVNGITTSGTDHNKETLTNGYERRQEIASLDVLKCLETVSIKSGDSRNSSATNKKKEALPFHGPVLSFHRMQALSNHIMSSADRINAGKPTAMAVSSTVAIGTNHGLAMVFDSDQNLAHVLGSVSVGGKYGAVTALAFNMDGDRLLVGYARGQILMYDTKSGKLLRTIADAHPPGCSILHVKFTDDPTLAVCNDSGGSVFELNFRRVMGLRSCESRCLFSGSRGEVCTLEPLHISRNIADHPLRDRHLLVMGTLTKILVVCLRPQIKVLFSHQLQRNSSSIPLLSWQLSVFLEDNVRSIDPILMFARGDVIYLFHVISEQWDEITFSHIQTMNVTYNLINLAWLNSKTILLLDSTERLHVVDVNTQSELETILLENVNLVYSSATFKSIATGGNVSKALAMVGEHACYHSMVPYSGTVLLLGDVCVYATKIRQWNDRIRATLGWPNGHQRALELALSYYNGTAKAVIGLNASPEKRKELVSEMILDILMEYVDLSMTKLCPENGKLELLIEFFKDVVPVCVEHCLHINRVDVLCGRIYERFRADCIAHGVFLECLEPYFLDDRLKTVSPIVMQDFVSHYESKNMLTNVEACLLHLDVASLDLHQVLNLCWAHGLFDAILSINNRVMLDYVGPLIEMLSMLTSAMSIGSQLSDNMTRLGSKLLAYVSCCLAGVAYPSGTLEEDAVDIAKKQMYGALVNYHLDGFDGEYPILSILLHFSTQELLNVLSLAFTEPEFQGPEGGRRVQQLVDILLNVMVDTPGFTPDQIGTLFVFVARQVARRQDDQCLRVNRMLIQQVLEYLTTPDSSDESAKHEERQQALVELLTSDVIGTDEDSSRLIALVERAGFYHALRLLYERMRRFDLIFETHLKDPRKKEHSFWYIKEIMQDAFISDDEKDLLVKSVHQNIKQLIEIDSDQTANLVSSVLPSSYETIASNLRDQPQMLYYLLKGLFNPTNSHFYDVNSTSGQFGDLDFDAPNPHMSNPEMVHMYLTLMCQYERSAVLSFLKSLESNRPPNALDTVRRYHADEATAYLLEEEGDYSAAFALLHRVAKEDLKRFVERCENELEDDSINNLKSTEKLIESKSIFKNVIGLCQRSSSKLSEEQMEKFWFPLLDTVVAPRREITRGKLDSDASVTQQLERLLKELAQHVLTSMMSHIPLPALLQKIIKDPAYDTGNFGEIKEILLGMLDTYQYERTLLDTTLSLLARDRHQSISSLRTAMIHGMAPRSQYCAACRETILGYDAGDKGESDVVVFGSGAVYHEACLRYNPALSPSVNPTISPFDSPGRSGGRSPSRSLAIPTNPGSMTPQEKRVAKERRNYADRNRQISNGSKIFLSAKGTKESSQTQGQRVFRKDGSFFAVPVPQNSARNIKGAITDNRTKSNQYVSRTRTLSTKTGEMTPQDFKLSIAAPTRIF